MKAGPETEAALRELLEHFCVGIARRDGETIMQLLAPDADVVIVTSGEALLRGRDDVSAFVQRYAHGSTTYTWIWDRGSRLNLMMVGKSAAPRKLKGAGIH